MTAKTMTFRLTYINLFSNQSTNYEAVHSSQSDNLNYIKKSRKRNREPQNYCINTTVPAPVIVRRIFDLARPKTRCPIIQSRYHILHRKMMFLLEEKEGKPNPRFFVDSIDQWRRVFEVSAIISILTYLIYQIFGTAEIQTWNKGLPVNDDSDEGKVLSTAKDDLDNTAGPI
ncbi:uncharacterized protein LOC117137794 isoform X5 [Drosophila mauritiana]|uniref:Uncharacterized protein LOC117137794 isoform X5 n=1 Tax=Drosophila mauritiana TaxID=7226 RepID=A0A6P8JYZ0_DROMA|nr:uncharacterized protein LOC117137794 isoform X5 [Drosophila mauritiana]